MVKYEFTQPLGLSVCPGHSRRSMKILIERSLVLQNAASSCNSRFCDSLGNYFSQSSSAPDGQKRLKMVIQTCDSDRYEGLWLVMIHACVFSR